MAKVNIYIDHLVAGDSVSVGGCKLTFVKDIADENGRFLQFHSEDSISEGMTFPLSIVEQELEHI
jgi:hypothetical protein